MTTHARKKFDLLTVAGGLFFALGIAVLVSIFYPFAREEVRYQVRQSGDGKGKASSYACPQGDFLIDIEELGVCARVIPDVDPLDSLAYQRALTQGVAHARGSGKPGEGKNIFIFAHSSESLTVARRYNSVFYLLYKLTDGDRITLSFQGKTQDFRVTGKHYADPTETQFMLAGKSEKLTLMTCWPPGTTLKRLIITAEPE